MSMESSAFADEDEVLVQDGLCYKVVSVESQLTIDTNQQFYMVKLEHKSKY